MAVLALALRFVPYSDDRGNFDPFWTVVMLVLFALVARRELLPGRHPRDPEAAALAGAGSGRGGAQPARRSTRASPASSRPAPSRSSTRRPASSARSTPTPASSRRSSPATRAERPAPQTPGRTSALGYIRPAGTLSLFQGPGTALPASDRDCKALTSTTPVIETPPGGPSPARHASAGATGAPTSPLSTPGSSAGPAARLGLAASARGAPRRELVSSLAIDAPERSEGAPRVARLLRLVDLAILAVALPLFLAARLAAARLRGRRRRLARPAGAPALRRRPRPGGARPRRPARRARRDRRGDPRPRLDRRPARSCSSACSPSARTASPPRCSRSSSSPPI